jgi:glycosyltransferase involved in cell wall biosynthesis
MNILYISLGAIEATYSSSFRDRAIITGFIELGHSVDVLTIFPDNLKITVKDSKALKEAQIIRINKVFNSNDLRHKESQIKTKLIWLGRKMFHYFSIFDISYFSIGKIDLSFLPKTQYDVIISSSDPKTSHILANKLINKGLIYKKWIQYWGDPLTIDITKKHIYPNFITKYIEGRIINGASKVIYVSPFTLERQKLLFKNQAHKLTFLPICYENEKIFVSPSQNKYTVGYFGYYSSEIRNILPLYHAFEKLDLSLHLNIVGTSDMELNNSKNVSVYPNSNEITVFEEECHLLVVILNKAGTQIPGKVYHAAATNLPILVVIDGEEGSRIEEYLRKYNRFDFCDNNSESIAQAIKEIRDSGKKRLPCTSLNARNVAESFLK